MASWSDFDLLLGRSSEAADAAVEEAEEDTLAEGVFDVANEKARWAGTWLAPGAMLGVHRNWLHGSLGRKDSQSSPRARQPLTTGTYNLPASIDLTIQSALTIL